MLVDEKCTLSGAQIHKGFSCLLNQVQIKTNANKFFRLDLVTKTGKYYLWKRWGRVGAPGAVMLSSEMPEFQAIMQFEKTFKDKTGLSWDDRESTPMEDHYAYMKLDCAPSSSGVVSALVSLVDPTLDDRVADVVKEICDERL